MQLIKTEARSGEYVWIVPAHIQAVRDGPEYCELLVGGLWFSTDLPYDEIVRMITGEVRNVL